MEPEEELKQISDEVLSLLRKYYSILNKEFQKGLSNADPISLAVTYIFYDDTYDAMENAFKHIKKLAIDLTDERALPEMFRARKVKTQPIAQLGKSVGYRVNSHWSFENRDQGLHWLRTHELGSVIKTDVHPQTLTKVLNEYREETGEDPPEKIFKSFDRYSIVVRGINTSNTPRGRKNNG